MITDIDGKESVGFLVAIKEALENPMEFYCNNPKRASSYKNSVLKHLKSRLSNQTGFFNTVFDRIKNLIDSGRREYDPQ
jgi:hypothetical protein